MIIEIERFTAQERAFWNELESALNGLQRDAAKRLTLEESLRLHYLYERAASDLAKLATFASEPRLHAYLESLVARAYAEVHGAGRRRWYANLWRWFSRTFPQTFRRHLRAFQAASAIFAVGAVFGAGAILIDYESKSVLTPFEHLAGNPSERVAFEESGEVEGIGAAHTTFSAALMRNNIQVSITAVALGLTFGIGTAVVLFFNGVILGAVACDYALAGETVFLLGWLLPHGSIEIPAILIGGQGGMLLGAALIGWGNAVPLHRRLALIRPDLVTLIFGLSILLVWAGIVEAFVSQYHRPAFVYGVKIAFGALELALLTVFLALAGRSRGGVSGEA